MYVPGEDDGLAIVQISCQPKKDADNFGLFWSIKYASSNYSASNDHMRCIIGVVSVNSDCAFFLYGRSQCTFSQI